MSTTVDFTTVTNSIAALNISGVTVKDVDEVTDTTKMSPATLAPRPEDFVTGISLVPAELSQQDNDLTYTLHYRYYHCQIVRGLGGMLASYSGLITKAAAILLAFSNDATLTGATNNTAPQIENIGPVNDPAGNVYLGFEISIQILQFLKV